MCCGTYFCIIVEISRVYEVSVRRSSHPISKFLLKPNIYFLANQRRQVSPFHFHFPYQKVAEDIALIFCAHRPRHPFPEICIPKHCSPPLCSSVPVQLRVVRKSTQRLVMASDPHYVSITKKTLTQVSKAISDFASLTSTYSSVGVAVDSWQSTQTALPDDVVNSQAHGFLTDGLRSTASLSAFITALPSSLQPRDASVLRSDYAAASPVSSGIPSNSANGTSGAPTTPASPTVATNPENAAGRKGMMMVGGVLAISFTGVLALL